MKITGVRCVPVLVPRRQAYGGVVKTALGAAAFSDYTIVFVDTDAGITGLGEVDSVFKRRGALLRHDLEKALVPAVIGEDPFRISRLVAKMDAVLDGVEEAKAAIEMALWDIVGKALDTPLYNLLGGKVRDSIPLSYSIPFGAPDDMARLAQERVKWGHRTIKVKVGSDDSARDIAAVQSIRAAIGPDVKLRVDGNMGWQTAKQAIAVIRAMEASNLELVEQPLPAHDLDGMAEVRRSIGVPLMADESVRNPRSAMQVILRGAADIANVYVTRRRTPQRGEDLRDVRGGRDALHDRQHARVRHRYRAQIHLGVAMEISVPTATRAAFSIIRRICSTKPLRIENGFSYPPEGPVWASKSI
jgi:muconate cycloisomerase